MTEKIKIPGVWGELARSDAPFIGEKYEKVLLTGSGKHGDGLFKDNKFVVIVKRTKQGEVVSCEVVCIIKNVALAKVTKRWPKETQGDDK